MICTKLIRCSTKNLPMLSRSFNNSTPKARFFSSRFQYSGFPKQKAIVAAKWFLVGACAYPVASWCMNGFDPFIKIDVPEGMETIKTDPWKSKKRILTTYAYIMAGSAISIASGAFISRSFVIRHFFKTSPFVFYMSTWFVEYVFNWTGMIKCEGHPLAKNVSWIVYRISQGLVMSPFFLLKKPILTKSLFYAAGIFAGVTSLSFNEASCIKKFLCVFLDISEVVTRYAAYFLQNVPNGPVLVELAVCIGLINGIFATSYQAQEITRLAKSSENYDPVEWSLQREDMFAHFAKVFAMNGSFDTLRQLVILTS